MFTLLKRPLYILLNKLHRHRQPAELMKEKWIADFSKPEKSCFDIKPEISYNAYLEKGSLFLGLKKKNCMAWLETADRVYVDQIIEAHFRFSCPGGHCAAGIMFRVNGWGTYYLALISNKGYFRLDAVNNNIPRPLIGWTEMPELNKYEVNLAITACGDHFIFILNNKWIAEAHDASIPGGHLGFALVSYETDEETYFPPESQSPASKESYTCHAWLDYLSVDSRATTVAAEHKKWRDNMEISAESRLRLAESLAALNHFDAAYEQVLKAWKQREEAARSVTATYTEIRTRKELLFAAEMASQIGHYAAADDYINACLAMDPDGAEGLDILAEKAKILSAQNKYGDLVAFLPDYIKRLESGAQHTNIPPSYALLGHAFWHLRDYKAAAVAWDQAFNLNKNNGLYAANAANAYEMMGKNKEALQRRLSGGECFLQQKNYAELGALVSKLLATANNNRQVHALAGKWALGIGDAGQAKNEAALADNLKRKSRSAKTTVTKKPAAKTPSSGKSKTKPTKAPVKSANNKTTKKQPAKTRAKPNAAAPGKTTAKKKGKTSG